MLIAALSSATRTTTRIRTMLPVGRRSLSTTSKEVKKHAMSALSLQQLFESINSRAVIHRESTKAVFSLKLASVVLSACGSATVGVIFMHGKGNGCDGRDVAVC